MKKISYSDFCSIMSEHHNGGDYKKAISGVIVYKPENWKEPYTETERSYRVYSNCHRFGSYISNEMTGNCLDGRDMGVRLDWYRWKVDYCYIDDEYEAVVNG